MFRPSREFVGSRQLVDRRRAMSLIVTGMEAPLAIVAQASEIR